MTTVLLADDHTLVRTGLRGVLDALPDVEVVGEAADGHEALRLIEKLDPDVALIDLTMPGLGGLEVVTRARRRFPRTRLLVLSMHANEAYVHQAMTSGAAGYLLKGADKSELELALRTVAGGGTHLSKAISKTIVAALTVGASARTGTRSPLEALTSRQREILQLIAEGRRSKEIAAKLDLSPKTVEAHRGQIMQRLGIRDVAGLVRFAIRVGMVPGDR